MKATEIITISHMNTNLPVFKDERLAKATQRIMDIYTDAAKYAEAKNRDISVVLAEVASKKSYEKDGFKSVADYAQTVFGISRQNAYVLANAGKVYSDKDALPELKAMSPSKLSEIASLDSKVIEKAVKDGTISKDTTQKDLRDFASKAKESGDSPKPIVLDTYTARPCVAFIDEKTADTYSRARTIDEWDDYFMDFVKQSSPAAPVEIIPIKKIETHDSNVKRIAQRRLYLNRSYSIVVEFYKYKPETSKPSKPAKPAKPSYTREELLKMLQDLETKDNGDTAQK